MQLFISVVTLCSIVCGYGRFEECVCRRSALLKSKDRSLKRNKIMYGHIGMPTEILTSTIYSQDVDFILTLSMLLLASSAKPSTITELRNYRRIKYFMKTFI